ncbi:DMT family transporter [Parahaliea sp. F7430]|uniref:DMT family transporter n=1 Tax=Sediminihaliea albiluteola TaxID=2758564 RepID=A0A7W2YJW8_9GAMM|nr:DMT family transporter [Sediminihaliea albiluteola]MBA6413044.1 DMT family transporter [Sediminihaliea albiluteola]
MTGKTVNSAILLLIIGNAIALVSDVLIKLLGSDTPVFQFAFIRCAITLLLLLPLWKQINHARLFEGAAVHFFRAHAHLAGIACMVIALGSLPLATANAIFYVAPILVMLLSVFIFRESLTRLSLLAVFCGFAGIVVILRPVEFNWAAIMALGSAASLAINAVMVRMLPKQQSTVHTLFLTYLMVLPASFLLMLYEGAPWNPLIMKTAIGSAVLILAYNVTVILAYRQVAANQVTSAEYTGLIWAVAIGWLWFDEVPDLWFVLGSCMIVIPLILISLKQRRLSRAESHFVTMSDLPDSSQ